MSNASQLRAMVTLLSPDEMTPVAKRQLERLADQWDEADLVPVAEREQEKRWERPPSRLGKRVPGFYRSPVDGKIVKVRKLDEDV